MKAKDIVLLRKKYIQLIFELANKSFKLQHDFLEEEQSLRLLMENDLLLIQQANKISEKIEKLSQDMKDLSKMAEFDKKALHEVTHIQSTLRQQQKNNKAQRQENYDVISKDYFNTLITTSMTVLKKLEEDELFTKMRLAVQKTEVRFIAYCKNWKANEFQEYQRLGEQIDIIHQFSIQLLKDIDSSIATETTDAYSNDSSINHISSLKNSRVAANCTTLAHYLENFKQLYPQTLGFKAKSLVKLNLKEDFNDFMENGTFGSMKASLKMRNKLTLAKKQVEQVSHLFHELATVNTKHLHKIEQQKQKMTQIAIGEYQLTQITIKQWLESDKKSLFFIFAEYLEKHKFSDH